MGGYIYTALPWVAPAAAE